MKIYFYFLAAMFMCQSIFSQTDTMLVLSEVMFNPQSGNNEFIEIYNLSETDSFDLAGYKIIYYTSNADVITSAGFGTILPPKSFAIIFEGDYDFAAGIYNSKIPANALKLKISDNSFGTSGMANTSDRPIWFVNASNDTISSLNYSANNGTGYSEEKIIINRNNGSSNWANSLVVNGTPGYRNSVTPANYDLFNKSLSYLPLIPIQGDDVQIVNTITNKGLLSATAYTVEIFNDANFDSVGNLSEVVFSQSFTNLQPGDSINISTTLPSISPGNYQIISKISFPSDEDTTNNKKVLRFNAYPPGNNYNDLVINEIMYAPSTGEPEWIELFNRTAEIINLKKWKLGDNSSITTITNNNLLIPPASFSVLAKDSSVRNYFPNVKDFVVFNLPSLNNSGDAVVLKDSLSVLIDSLEYLPGWGGNTGGRSLERISVDAQSTIKENWGTSQSVFKATPDQVNSITPKDFDLSISYLKSLNEYAIIGETAELEIKIINKGLNDFQNFKINIFNDFDRDSLAQNSELIGEINGNFLKSADSTILSFSSTNFVEGKNYFIAKLETNQDDDTTNNVAFANLKGVSVNEIRNDVIINEIMYSPLSPEPEWIEIYNRSNKIIDLKNYQVADNSDTVRITSTSVIINPGEYIVVTDDNLLTNYYNISSIIIAANIPSLNNVGDKIILLDSLDRVIDSLQYYTSWGGNEGKSLERITPENSSIDSLNWKTSLSKYKATPGYINSISQKDFDAQITNIIFIPPYPFFGNDVFISATVKNNGTNSANIQLNLWEDTNLDSIPDIKIEGIDSVAVSASDSVTIRFNFTIADLQNERAFLIAAELPQDQDTSNNYFYKGIFPGYIPQTVLINEIMYTPINGEPEWIELFNNSNDSINLKNWSITDIFTTPFTTKINNDVYFPGKSFLVLAKDSTLQYYHRVIPSKIVKMNLPNLNNDVDGIVLQDNRGLTLDSVKYFNDWGGTEGRSLERISLSANSTNPGNWGSSKDLELSTPGRINSVTPKQFDLSINEISFTPRFPISGEDVYINVKVKNNGSSAANNFSIEFYIDTDSNQIIDQMITRLEGLNLGASDSAVFTSSSPINGLSSKILTAVKIIFENDEDTLNNYAEKPVEPGFAEKSIVISEVMFAPINGEPEWVELVNNSDHSVDLKDWSISDILTTPTKSFITNSDLEIQPGEYFVVTRDTSFYNFHSPVDYRVFISNFGSLGNSEDGIILYDFRNGIIDSFYYNSDFGGINGYSLERVSISQSTNEISNWITSLSVNHSTPGKQNSIINIPSYKNNDLVINEIMYDPDIDNCEFIEFLNISNDSINVGGWKFEDENQNLNKLSQTSMVVPPNNYFLLFADSLALSKYNIEDYPFKTILDVSSLGLINTGELILLKDARGNKIDSIAYSDKWHNKNYVNTKNISLERINPLIDGNDSKNWSSSASPDGATPAQQNSIFAENKNQESNISVSPNPFSPDNDGFEDFSIISYNLSMPTSQVRIKIFDSKGRLVRTLLNNRPSGARGYSVFNGLGDDGAALRIGIYIIFLEALNETEGVAESLKTTVVVARKL